MVSGILIALSINNWNENDKDRQKEKYYLESLKSEFLENKKIIEQGIGFHKAQMQNAKLVLAVMANDTILSNLEGLHFALLQSGWAWSGNFKEDVWSELINTGNVGLITNNELRGVITEFHSNADAMVIAEKEWSIFNLRYREITGDVLPPKLRISVGAVLGHYRNQGPILEPLLSQKQIEQNLNRIVGAGAILSDIIITRRVGLIFLDNIADNIEDIQQKLELGKLLF